MERKLLPEGRFTACRLPATLSWQAQVWFAHRLIEEMRLDTDRFELFISEDGDIVTYATEYGRRPMSRSNGPSNSLKNICTALHAILADMGISLPPLQAETAVIPSPDDVITEQRNQLAAFAMPTPIVAQTPESDQTIQKRLWDVYMSKYNQFWRAQMDGLIAALTPQSRKFVTDVEERTTYAAREQEWETKWVNTSEVAVPACHSRVIRINGVQATIAHRCHSVVTTITWKKDPHTTIIGKLGTEDRNVPLDDLHIHCAVGEDGVLTITPMSGALLSHRPGVADDISKGPIRQQ